MKFKKKTEIVEAIQLTKENYQEILDWIGSKWPHGSPHEETAGLYGNVEDGKLDVLGMWVKTLQGEQLNAGIRWWIIKDAQGEFCICDPSVFEKTYEAIGWE